MNYTNDINNWYGMTDMSIIRSLWVQLKQVRLNKNLTQQQLANIAGIDRTTLSELENGVRPATLLTFIQVLRALEKLEVLNALAEIPTISPMQVAEAQGKYRKRAYPKKNKQQKEESEW
jgi:transcriptional regulator with XRE-family HTH domain